MERKKVAVPQVRADLGDRPHFLHRQQLPRTTKTRLSGGGSFFMNHTAKRSRFRALITYVLTLAMLLYGIPVSAAENGKPSDAGGDAVRSANFVPVDLAQGTPIERIKVSSFRKGSKPENVFKEGTSEYWDVDPSQSTPDAVAEGKNRFWIAVDLEETRNIFQFVIAFQTNFTQLKDRVSQYRIEYTNDPDKWEALSTATVEGPAGLESYKQPEGWTVAITQNTADLVDGNGNKTMVYTLDDEISARYVMLTGEMKPVSTFIRIFNFMIHDKVEIEPETIIYPTENITDIIPVYPGINLTIGRPALVELGESVPKFMVTAKKDITISGVLRDPEGNPVYELLPQSVSAGATLEITPDATASMKEVPM
jgi:hypothetical protein